jgi:phage/plasmid-associated DNA primase
MDAEAYKVIVTGESVSVERKNKASVEHRFDMPVMLTMNAFPIIRDSSDAVYNRTLVLPMLSSQSEQDSREVAREVIEGELSGVLNWAVEGWKRLRDRGWFEPPPVMQAAVAEFKGQNNPFAEFAELCLQANPDIMIMRHDLNLVFNAWIKSEAGGREWSGKAIARGLKGVIEGVSGHKVSTGRVWAGVRFTEAAMTFVPQEFGAARRDTEEMNRGLSHEIRAALGRPTRTKF